MALYNNVFVLCTGRCGSTTLTKALNHVKNYSCTHESLKSKFGEKRFDYDNFHIEIDNRLSWNLGRLDEAFGKDPFYIHLTRDLDATARSFVPRNFGIFAAYKKGLMAGRDGSQDFEIAKDMCELVNANIRLFLKDKPNKMNIQLENFDTQFEDLWNNISAVGNLEKAKAELSTPYNATPEKRK